MPKSAKEKYPWKQCIKDQMKEYGNQETAEKVCGKIKFQSQGKKAEAKRVAYLYLLKHSLIRL